MNIKHIRIQNFKSIRDLELDVRRVNVFIGEPNTGKSNVLEALSLLSENLFEGDNFRSVVRFQSFGDFFFDNDISKTVRIQADQRAFELGASQSGSHFGTLNCKLENKAAENDKERSILFSLDPKGKVFNDTYPLYSLKDKGFRRYIFEKLEKFQPLILPYLKPPFGENLPQVLHNHPNLRKQVSDILRERGFRLLLKPVESEINLAKEVNEELFSYPFQTVSETWKRIIFMLAVLETNQDQVLILDEPEANIFPFFNTQIAETIGLYNTNQFFITTHNPYLLQSLIAKTPRKDLCVFVTRMENFETKVQQMDAEQLSEAMDLGSGIFFNLDDVVPA